MLAAAARHRLDLYWEIPISLHLIGILILDHLTTRFLAPSRTECQTSGVQGRQAIHCAHSAAQQRESVLVTGQPIAARISEVAPYVVLHSPTCDGFAPVGIIAEKKSRKRAGGFEVIDHDFAVQRVL